MNIEQYLEDGKKTDYESKPIIFDFSIQADVEKANALFEGKKIQQVIDDYEEEQQELFAVKNPSLVYTPDFKKLFADHYEALQQSKPLWQDGNWVYFPWISRLVHILKEEDFQLVRTARNKNLINKEEQEKFYNSTIAIGGLSVGSNVALALVLQGGGKRLKLADMDRLALSNTNRIITGVENLGVLKVEMMARKLYQINPYMNIETFTDGLSAENLPSFLEGVNVMIDEIDNLSVKYLIRQECQKRGIPIVMAADNGDNAVVDVERYDLDKSTPLFHGRIGDMTYEELTKLDKFGIGKTITKHIGAENVTERMQQSLLEMGKTIVSWPQLGGAALLNGTAVAYCVRKILNNQEVITNRSLISMDALLDPTYLTEENTNHRNQLTEGFKKMFGL